MISANSDQTEADLNHLLRQLFEKLPEVRSVLFTDKKTTWGVLAFVTANDEAIRERIYEATKLLRGVIQKRDVEITIVLAGESPMPPVGSSWTVVFDKKNPAS